MLLGTLAALRRRLRRRFRLAKEIMRPACEALLSESWAVGRGSVVGGDAVARVRRQAAQDRGQETQRSVVEGAASAFDRAGYGSTSLSDIAEASGISQGSMYFHFGSKEQIALAVINEQHRRSLVVLREVLGAHTDPLEQLVLVSRAVADQLVTDPVVRAGIRLAIDEPVLRESAGDFYEDWVQGAATVLERAIRDRVVHPSVVPAEVARALIGFFTGTHIMSEATTGRSDLLPALRIMWMLIIDAIATPERRDDAKALVARTFS